tara:strand:- start:7210 stop:8268 length:1059 start_codon:yes stop_codon:yes gene_type:complete
VSGGIKWLVVGPSWVGDMVMAQSLFKLLVSREPNSQVDVVAPTWSISILDRMSEVDDVMELNVVHGHLALSARWALGQRLREKRYDRAIILPRSLKASLVPFFATIPVRTGYRGEWRYGLINDMRSFDANILNQTIKKMVFLGLGSDEENLPLISNPTLNVDKKNLDLVARRLRLNPSIETVALIPGAEYGPAKQWPVEKYAELASRLVSVGLQVWVLGSEKERQLGDAIVAMIKNHNVINLCGKTSLEDVVDLIASVKVAVTNDSGLMHVAAAVNTHVIALYGSSSPALTPPLTEKKDIFYLDLECSPCFRRECPLDHFKCMNDIGVEEICSAVVTVLGGTRMEADNTHER